MKRAGWRLLWSALAAGVLLIVGGAALAAQPRSSAAPTLLLPDLEQQAPGELNGTTVEESGTPHFHLGFLSAVDNVGAGPLLIAGRRASRARKTMVAEQLVRRADGSTLVVPRVGKLRYVHSETHSHWHLLRFDRYELRRLSGYALIRPDRKTGFCLGDRYETAPGTRLPGEPPKPVWTGQCGKHRPGLLSVREGISVGYGDDYKPTLEGQYFDVTKLPAARYVLVHRVNVDHRLRESDYSNDGASMVFDLTWPHGFRQSPRINVLRRCPSSPFCEPR